MKTGINETNHKMTEAKEIKSEYNDDLERRLKEN